MNGVTFSGDSDSDGSGRARKKKGSSHKKSKKSKKEKKEEGEAQDEGLGRVRERLTRFTLREFLKFKTSHADGHPREISTNSTTCISAR